MTDYCWQDKFVYLDRIQHRRVCLALEKIHCVSLENLAQTVPVPDHKRSCDLKQEQNGKEQLTNCLL